MVDVRRWLIGLVVVIGLAGCSSTADSGATPVQAGSTSAQAAGSVSSTAAASAAAGASATTTASASATTSTIAPPPTRSTSTALSNGPVPSRAPGARLTLTGTVQAGVEANCLVLEDEKTGLRVNITGGAKAVVRLGSRITVVGQIRTDLMSYCQQGPVFVVISATAG